MKPDFGDAFLRGVASGIVGLISQPMVAVILAVMLVVGIVARRRRRR